MDKDSRISESGGGGGEVTANISAASFAAHTYEAHMAIKSDTNVV